MSSPQGENINLQDIPENPDDNYSKLLHTFLKFVNTDVSDLKRSVSLLLDENENLKAKLLKTEKRLSLSEGMICQLNAKVASQEKALTDLRCRMMRENIVIRGIAEDRDETWEVTKQKVVDFMKNDLLMPDADEDMIDRAHRTGEKNNKGPRPVVIKFKSSADKDNIFQYVKHLKNKPGLSVQEQLPPEVQETRKRLWSTYKEAKKNKANNVKWSVDKLIINGKVHTANDDAQVIDPKEDNESVPIVHTEHINKNGNIFIGHAANISKESEIPSVLAALLRDRLYAGASHTMYAYRVGRTNNIKESFRDDREHGSGAALLKFLRDGNHSNTIVIVSRWLGEHLGPYRFEVFKECAQDAVDKLMN